LKMCSGKGVKRKLEDLEEGEIFEGEVPKEEEKYDDDLIERVCFSFLPPPTKLGLFIYFIFSAKHIWTPSKMYSKNSVC
jgi:hypothetical protein